MNDVRDEALAATLERTVGTIESTSLDRFEEILQRGRRRRAVRSSVVISAVIVFVGAVTWTGLHWLQPGDDPMVSADTGEPPDMVRTLHDTEHGFTFSVPEDWVVADANLTPLLSSPVEILSVGTFPLRVSDDPDAGLRLFDAPVAPQALAEMSSTDVFVSLQESGERFTGPAAEQTGALRTSRLRPRGHRLSGGPVPGHPVPCLLDYVPGCLERLLPFCRDRERCQPGAP